MAGSGETHPAACRRTKPASACLCALGKDSHSYPGVPMGKRTETHAEPALAAASAVRTDDGEGTRRAAYAYCKRRRVHPCHRTAAGDSGCGRGVLRTVGGPATGKESRGVCLLEKTSGTARLHAAETECGGIRRADAGLSLPDGHRYLAAE